MEMLKIHLFGKFLVQHNEQVLDGFDARKVQELFSYLLLHRDHPICRERLAGILWPESLEEQAKKSLRQTLWQLQSALGSQKEPGEERIVLADPDWVQLNPKADLWLDVAMFEQAFASVQKVPGQALKACQAQLLQHAAELSQEPLLEGWYEDWCLQERERLQSMYLIMLDKLMDYCEAHHDYETGLFYGMRILCHERTRERTHRRLMRLHYLAGDRASALRQYERCAAILDEELGVKPSKRTVTLHKHIFADQLEEPCLRDNPGTAPEGASPPLLEALHSLSQLQTFLAGLQHQVQQNIQQAEYLLRETQKMPSSSNQRPLERHPADAPGDR